MHSCHRSGQAVLILVLVPILLGVSACRQSPEQQLVPTVETLATQNAQLATQVARWQEATSYLSTRVPAQNRVRAVDDLIRQNAYLSTRVAELYAALGTPLPAPPDTPTPGPSPFPTMTPYTP